MTVKVLQEVVLSPEDHLDGLLRAYFQSEMPHPWPDCPTPAVSVVVPARPALAPRRWLTTSLRSRLALAASIAVLVVGSLFLAGSASRPVSDGLESIPGARETDKAERLPLPGTNYRQTEGLLQKSDGTYIQIDFFELPPPK